MIENISGDLDTATGLYGLDAEFPYLIVCPTCDGTGDAYATKFSPKPTNCRECDGLREVPAE